MDQEPLTSTKWLHVDRDALSHPHATVADTDGRLDWDKAVRLAWRPAWSIRSRRGSVAPFLRLIGSFLRRRRG